MLLLLFIALCCATLLAAGAAWLMPVLCYAAGLAVTLALAAHLTPAAWWRKPTARGLFIVAGGAWACGSALALAAGLAAQPWPEWHARRAPQPAAAIIHQPFRVHRALNLRAGPAVASGRLAVLPAGTLLTPTGQRTGDWWQVRNDHDGQTGWVSSLWLRRPGESAN